LTRDEGMILNDGLELTDRDDILSSIDKELSVFKSDYAFSLSSFPVGGLIVTEDFCFSWSNHP